MAGRRPGRCVLRPGLSRPSPPSRAAATSCPAREAAREPSAIPSGAWQPPRRPRLPATCSCLVGAGVYEGTWTINRSGAPGQPIVWRGQSAGTAIIDTQGHGDTRPSQGISASGSHDVWFEGLTIQNAIHGAVFHDAARIVVRYCHIRRVDYGITATRNTQGTAADHFISDNLIEGPSTWPRTKGIEDARGIQVSGQGHVVCYKRIRGFADAIDTFPSRRCSAIDFHNNDLSELTDDGIEMVSVAYGMAATR